MKNPNTYLVLTSRATEYIMHCLGGVGIRTISNRGVRRETNALCIRPLHDGIYEVTVDHHSAPTMGAGRGSTKSISFTITQTQLDALKAVAALPLHTKEGI